MTKGTRTTITLLASLAMASAALAAPKDAVTDRGWNDLGMTPGSPPEGPWAAIHTQVTNSDVINLVRVGANEVRWHALKREGPIPGALSPFVPVPHPDGIHVWQTSGRGRGFSHVHKINRFTGEVVWESPPWMGRLVDNVPGAVGPGAIFDSPAIDDQGRVFVTDKFEPSNGEGGVYAFDADGNLLWQTNYADIPLSDQLTEPITNGFIGHGIILGNLVGATVISGQWLWLDRDTGEVEIAQDYLPSTAVPCEGFVRLIAILVGTTTDELDPLIGADLVCAALGRGLTQTETPALDPSTGFVLQTNGTETPEGESVSRLAAWEIVEEKKTGELEMAPVWTQEFPSGAASSPTVNVYDGLVYSPDGSGQMTAYDNETGRPIWVSEEEGLSEGFSPPTDQDGNLLVGSGGDRTIRKYSAEDGSLLWSQTYDFLAAQSGLPTCPTVPFLIEDGTPKTMIVSPPMPGFGNIGVLPTFGYPTSVSNLVTVPRIQASFTVTNLDGTFIPDTLSLIGEDLGGVIDGGLFDFLDGWGVGSLVEVQTAFWRATFNPLFQFAGPELRECYFLEGEGVQAGFFGTEAASKLRHAQEQLTAALGWLDRALQFLAQKQPDPRRAFDYVRIVSPNFLGGANYGGTTANVQEAADDGEIPQISADLANAEIVVAANAAAAARDRLLGNPKKQDIEAAVQLINASRAATTAALSALGG